MENTFQNPCTKRLAYYFNLIFIGLLFFVQPAFSQGDSPDPCIEFNSAFEGSAEETLCEEYGNITCDLEIGVGTSLTKSSQLTGSSFTGNVCITGDFEIDKSFSFIDCIIQIDPGVTITVSSPSPHKPNTSHIFTLDNCKLYACDELWEGIVLSSRTTINTLNNTKIEDAETAIKAVNTQYCNLLISHTTFNRNRIGISLESSVTTPQGPYFFVFEDNVFECDAPLNGTIDEITEIGINISNIFHPFLDNLSSNNNSFLNIVNGIVAVGPLTDIAIYGFLFDNIRNKAINFNARLLKVYHSTFENIQSYGIYFYKSFELDLLNNEFYMRTSSATTTRVMVYIHDPLAGNLLHLHDNEFYALENFTEINRALYIHNQYNLQVHAIIHYNRFSLKNTGKICRGMELTGTFTTGSDVDIEENDFDAGGALNNRSIYCDYGQKNELHIINNDFTGNGAVWIKDSDGENNEITQNEFFQSANLGAGMIIYRFKNLLVCSNYNYSASTNSYTFREKCNNMTFTGNITYGGSAFTFSFTEDAEIGQQIHTGNEFHPGAHSTPFGTIIDQPYLQHANTDQTFVNLSKFFVHTDQSVYNSGTGTYSVFSEYHPYNIVPDAFPLVDAFFEKDAGGSPEISCISQIVDPEVGDKLIADSTYGDIVNDAIVEWDAELYLYRKIKSNPAYKGTYPGFDSFMQNKSTSNIGKFYQIEQKINAATTMQTTPRTNLENARTAITTLDADIDDFRTSINYTEDSLRTLLNERFNLLQDIESGLQQHADTMYAKLGEAKTILQTITTSLPHEIYRKTVFEIYLDAQLEQNGQFDSLQTQQLKEIADLCYNDGGGAVSLARGFLSPCDLMDIQEEIDECDPEYEPEPKPGNNSVETSTDFSEEGFFIYPNPTQGNLVITNKKMVDGTTKIYTVTGEFLRNYQISKGESVLNIDLPSGIYLLKTSFENGETIANKLVVNK